MGEEDPAARKAPCPHDGAQGEYGHDPREPEHAGEHHHGGLPARRCRIVGERERHGQVGTDGHARGQDAGVQESRSRRNEEQQDADGVEQEGGGEDLPAAEQVARPAPEERAGRERQGLQAQQGPDGPGTEPERSRPRTGSAQTGSGDVRWRGPRLT